MKTIITILIVASILTLSFILTLKGIEKAEMNECYYWIHQDETIEGFYWTEWQVEQCKVLGIIE
jgi:hypothetical protein